MNGDLASIVIKPANTNDYVVAVLLILHKPGLKVKK